MQVMPKNSPCRRCKVTLVKTGGATGMCRACREADPVMAEEMRQMHRDLAKAVHDMVMATSDPDPFGRPGVRKVRPGAIDAYFGRGKPKRRKR
jgi:hypothetical protein